VPDPWVGARHGRRAAGRTAERLARSARHRHKEITMEDKKSPPKTPSWGTPAPAVSSGKGAKPAPTTKPAAGGSDSPPAGENRYTQWYEVQSGDTLWKIAKEHYGDGSLYTEIFKANQDVLTDPDKIKVGQKLRIP
jgi:nucleoid-associated protein YgaU